MNSSKKHRKIAYIKFITLLTGTSIDNRTAYWAEKNKLTPEELRYLIADGWTIYGKTVRDILFSKEGISHE